MPHEQIVRLIEKIRTYDKENLEEMLFAAGEGVRLIAGTDRVRIYLEDLTRGALSCGYASGPFASEIRETTFPIISEQSLVSRVLMSGKPDGCGMSCSSMETMVPDVGACTAAETEPSASAKSWPFSTC